MSTPLFRALPYLQPQIAWTPLTPGPTHVHRLSEIGFRYSHPALYVKREDATDSVYGGNKVRNLEFLLGRAQARNKKNVITIAPVGSNFVAALAAQAKKLNLGVEVMHFSPVSTPQTHAHFCFSQAQGMKATVFPGRLGTIPAVLMLAFRQTSTFLRHAEWIAPGGSSPTGALGHLNALFELKEQIDAGLVPAPDVIVVGAGTCGTMAGLTVGIALAGLNTKLIGVRCVDRLVCHRRAIARLANRLFALVQSAKRVSAADITLITPQAHEAYGVLNQTGRNAMRLFREEEDIELDTTYTAKVASFLTASLEAGEFRGKKVLYWHTFSPKAVLADHRPAVALEYQSPWLIQASPYARDPIASLAIR